MRKVSRAINSSPEMPSKQKLPSKSEAAQFDALALAMSDDDDDFQNPSHAFSLTQNLILSSFEKPTRVPISQPLKPSNGSRSSKKTKSSTGIGKENARVASVFKEKKGFEAEKGCVRNSTGFGVSESSMSCSSIAEQSYSVDGVSTERIMEKGLDMEAGCSSNLIESGSLESSGNCCSRVDNRCCVDGDFGYGVSAECNDKNRNKSDKGYVLASMESQLLEPSKNCSSSVESVVGDGVFAGWNEKKGFLLENGYLSNSIESRLLASKMESNSIANSDCLDECSLEDFEPGTQLNVLMKMCSELGEEGNSNGVDFWEGNGSGDGLVECPLCGIDISDLGEEQRHVHTNCCLDREEQGRVQTNECLDRDEIQKVVPPCVDMRPGSPPRVVDVSPVLEWLCSLGLSRYEEAFVREEIDWDTLQWLTEEDLFSIGVTALGPRKKIVHALSELRKGSTHTEDAHTDDASKITIDRTSKLAGNKLITEYFSGSFVDRKRDCTPVRGHRGVGGSNTDSGQRRIVVRDHARKGKLRDIPLWCCIPGTPFRVDAFRYLRGDCSYWFLTHFHTDHYQGLTRNFRHGKIYCSSITAQLVNMKIGIPWDRLQVLPLNQKISIENVDVTCLDANHCPGSIIILFEPPNGKAVLHTGDFRFSEEMKCMSVLQRCPVHTLILDTTYCNPQYDFPKQEAVIQFVIEAIQAEDFNPKTLFLIGSYTIGKERLFLEVARVLRKKVYVGAAKLRLLECLGLPKEDMQWFTMNEQESHIHVVPMWTIASFKRMKHLSTQYLGRFNLIVAFSPTGWTFGKGKKKTPGRRWQQGTIIRYEVPYSEHCSFTELREFVQFVSPENIIPSVNNDGPESTDAMISLLVS